MYFFFLFKLSPEKLGHIKGILRCHKTLETNAKKLEGEKESWILDCIVCSSGLHNQPPEYSIALTKGRNINWNAQMTAAPTTRPTPYFGPSNNSLPTSETSGMRCTTRETWGPELPHTKSKYILFFFLSAPYVQSLCFPLLSYFHLQKPWFGWEVTWLLSSLPLPEWILQLLSAQCQRPNCWKRRPCQLLCQPHSSKPCDAWALHVPPRGSARFSTTSARSRSPFVKNSNVFFIVRIWKLSCSNVSLLAQALQHGMQGLQPGWSSALTGLGGLKKQGSMPRWPECPEETDSHGRVQVSKVLW